LQPLKAIFPTEDYPNLLVGLAQPDDSAVYALNAEQAIVSTVDFFPPVVDNPYDFGAIAAANALSDVYAMGGEPIMAINLVAYPEDLEMALLTEILRGGAEKVREAGAVIAGGHTVTDKEPKYGLAVTGIVPPGQILTKSGVQPGDRLILTKPLGVGVVTTALKRDLTEPDEIDVAVASMKRLNRDAARLARQHQAHAVTDITGYGLLGHGHEMAHLSGVDFHLHSQALNWLPGARKYAEQDVFPGGMWRNKDYFEQWVRFDDRVPEALQYLLFDPETSGGLLIAVAAAQADELCADLLAAGDQAQLIGDVLPGGGGLRVSFD
jgi:selenide,water dikinase